VKYGIAKKNFSPRLPIRMNHGDLQCVFKTREDYKNWVQMERGCGEYIRKNFSKKERLIVFLTWFCKPRIGLLQIRKRTGISTRQIIYIRTKMRQYI
jgi:hypothetical protein